MKSFQIGDLTIPVPILQGGTGIVISLSGLETLNRDILKITIELQDKYQQNIPVIASRCITNGKQIIELFRLGTSVVQLGCHFITTKECDAANEFKRAIINSNKKNIRIIKRLNFLDEQSKMIFC